MMQWYDTVTGYGGFKRYLGESKRQNFDKLDNEKRKFGQKFGRQVRPSRFFSSRSSLQQQELKFFDGTRALANVPTTGSVRPSLNLITRGTGENQRIGRKVIIRQITIRFTFTLPESIVIGDIPDGDIIRVILYIDKQANGANAAVTDILETAEIDSYLNLTNKGRFRILFNKFYSMNRNTQASVLFSGSTNVPFQTSQVFTVHRHVAVEIEFSGSADTIAEIATNNIALMYISQLGDIAVRAKLRLRYDG